MSGLSKAFVDQLGERQSVMGGLDGDTTTGSAAFCGACLSSITITGYLPKIRKVGGFCDFLNYMGGQNFYCMMGV